MRIRIKFNPYGPEIGPIPDGFPIVEHIEVRYQSDILSLHITTSTRWPEIRLVGGGRGDDIDTYPRLTADSVWIGAWYKPTTGEISEEGPDEKQKDWVYIYTDVEIVPETEWEVEVLRNSYRSTLHEKNQTAIFYTPLHFLFGKHLWQGAIDESQDQIIQMETLTPH